MKIGTFRVDGQTVSAIVDSDQLVPLPTLFPGLDLDIAAIAAAGLLPEIARRLPRAPRLKLADAVTLPPIPRPGKLICVGVNYEDHRLEGKREPAAHPTLFTRFAESLAGHGDALLRPRESAMFDFEGEIAVVIGRRAYRVATDDALDHVFGYACFNDASVRDWQRHTSQWLPGKNFMATGGFGPWVTTADEAGDPRSMTLTTRLNGEVVQRAEGRDMLFSIPEIIAYVTTFTVLEPGDVIASGTPGGVGYARQPQLFMKAGDVVDVEVSGVGILRNTVADAT
jgi:2-keto-4-pentenoate hydratase/2-oxohepta-3-ene-1,7-dioic acid hydratase in catechol pathway